MIRARIACLIFLTIVLSSCSQNGKPCMMMDKIEIAEAEKFASDPSLPFRFPLETYEKEDLKYHAWFCDWNTRDTGILLWRHEEYSYHAAEDYGRPAGTPVYAIADGTVSFSGRMGGYGWLIIVDHPRYNIYSLYGHLSPSRWKTGPGPVKKGQLLAYLGDPWENGGSRKKPLVTHLHHGIRAGQRADYPRKGQWRFMAGWINLCPADIGWLQPSLVINSQAVPEGGFKSPAPRLFDIWGTEIVISSIYVLFGLCMLVYAFRKKKPWLALFPGTFIAVAWAVLHWRDIVRTYYLLPIAAVMLTAGIIIFNKARDRR